MKSTEHRPARPRQRGQAIVWFLATVAACCCVFALVYNVGQVANKKEENTNAADAAALSGALVEARMLNYQAYTNRAMIANEVTIAQLISLDSWMRYNNKILYYIKIYTTIVPYLNSVTQTLSQVSQQVTDGIDNVVGATVPRIEDLNSALSGVREYAYRIGAVAANDVAAKIARANSTTSGGAYDDTVELTASPIALSLNQLKWSAFTEQNNGDGRSVEAKVVLNSRDPFSTARGNGDLIDGINDVLEVVTGAGSLGTDIKSLKKTSGTTTLQDYDHWAAQDSLDVMTTTLFGGKRPDLPPIPLGYGRVDANSDDSTGDNLCKTYINLFGLKIPTLNCELAVNDDPGHVSWKGLPSIRDLVGGLSKTDPCSTNNGSDSPSLTYVMAVDRPGSGTMSTQRMGLNADVSGPQGSPAMRDALIGDKLTSAATACVFFLRPDGNDTSQVGISRSDGRHEFASLYNPYWQARLTTPDSNWVSTLYALIGRPGLDRATQ